MTDRLGHLMEGKRAHLVLPLPPSDNVYYGKPRGLRHKYVTKKGRVFKHEVAVIVYDKGLRGRFPRGKLAVRVVLHMSVTADVTNRAKALFDALQDAELIRNDNQIDDVRMIRGHPVKGGRCEVTIWRMQHATSDV